MSELEEKFDIDDLHFYAQQGDVKKVKELLIAGFPINTFDELGKTALHYAAEIENLEIIQILLGAGANINAHKESVIGNTPLGEVAGSCSFDVAKILVEAGADPTIPGWMQLTALHHAERRKKPEGKKVYELLLKTARR
jgi:ankyrin repeat protein